MWLTLKKVKECIKNKKEWKIKTLKGWVDIFALAHLHTCDLEPALSLPVNQDFTKVGWRAWSDMFAECMASPMLSAFKGSQEN